MQHLSYFDSTPNEIILKQIIEILPHTSVTQCLTLNKLWYELIINSNLFKDMKAIHEWPRVVELPKKIISIFGSIAKIHQVPLLELRRSGREFYSIGLEKTDKEIMEKGINAGGYWCAILPLDQLNQPIMYWIDSKARPNCLFKAKYTDGNSKQKQTLIHLFRSYTGYPKDNIHAIEQFLNNWNIHCYSQDEIYVIEVQKFLLENNPFEILKTLNLNGSFWHGTRKIRN